MSHNTDNFITNLAVYSVAGLFLLFVTVILIVPATIINGYVLSQLWSWFIVPVFGLPSLNIATAMGLAMTAAFLTKANQYKENKDENKFTIIMLQTFVAPFIVLLFGYILSFWV